MFSAITGVFFFIWVGWFCPFRYQTLIIQTHTHTKWISLLIFGTGDSERDRVNADSLAKQMFISISECSCEAIRLHYPKQANYLGTWATTGKTGCTCRQIAPLIKPHAPKHVHIYTT